MKDFYLEISNIIKKNNRKKIFLFLDYDGTLSPIKSNPNNAKLPFSNKLLLDKLSRTNKIAVAIISGRSLEDIKKMVGIASIIYAGNHGLEIEYGDCKYQYPVTGLTVVLMRAIKEKIYERLSFIKGLKVEDKGLSLSIHYRRIKNKYVILVKDFINKAVVNYKSLDLLKIRKGKKVFEIIPSDDWNKGRCVLWILRNIPKYKNISSVMPIYIGDDETDEDAFRAIKDIGISIYVGKKKKTCAKYRIKNTRDVTIFLKNIASNFMR